MNFVHNFYKVCHCLMSNCCHSVTHMPIVYGWFSAVEIWSYVIDMQCEGISHDDTSGRRPSKRALILLTSTWNRHGIWHLRDWFMQTRCRSIAYMLSLRLFYASSMTVGAKPSLITCQGHGWCVVYDWMLWNYVWFNVCGIKWHGHNLTDRVVTWLTWL